MGQLIEAVEKGRQLLREAEVQSERALEHVVILPILRGLGWDPERLDEMYPDYSAGSGRVDFALCKAGEPCLFLEEKAPDQNLTSHEEQLLQYAFQAGVRLALLTNGREWWFYLPLEEGPWQQRKFAVVDLLEEESARTGKAFFQFLKKTRIHDGSAYDLAKKMYDEAKERERIESELPRVIAELVSSPSPEIVALFQSQAQADLGVLPPEDLVRQALAQIHRPPNEPETLEPALESPGTHATAQDDLPPPGAHVESVTIESDQIEVRHWKQVLVETANWAIRRGYQLPVGDRAGRSRSPLLTDSPGGLRMPERLSDGHYIETNYSARSCVQYARWLLKQLGAPPDTLQVTYRPPEQ